MTPTVSRRTSLADELATALARRITLGNWEPGDRLPTEMQLSEEFKVSRPVVREALSRLKTDGYVTSHQGKGVFVADGPGLLAFRIDMHATPEAPGQVLEMRIMVEQACAALAAERRTTKDLNAMKSALQAMSTAYACGALGIEADMRFHEAIATATQNPVLGHFMKFVGRRLREELRRARLAVEDYQGRMGQLNIEHEEILDAIENRDPVKARAAVRRRSRLEP